MECGMVVLGAKRVGGVMVLAAQGQPSTGVRGYGPSALPSTAAAEVGARACVAELLQPAPRSTFADTLLVAERLNVARINIAVAQTARQSRTPAVQVG